MESNLALPYTSAGGDTWHKIYIHNGRIYAYSQEKMYFTDNLGVNWSNISLPAQYCNRFYDFLIVNSIPFAAACGNGQVLKLDGTQQWVLSNNGLPQDREPLSLAFCDSALFAHILVHGMYVSFDNGNSWSYANNGLTPNPDIGFRDFVKYNTNLFIATENGVFITSNFGQNWYPLNSGLKNLNTTTIKIFNDTLYVGTYGNGVWKQAIANVALGVQDQQHSYELIKIFPNPFSSQTTLSTETPFKYATLSVDNCFGQTVKRITNITGNTISISRDNLPTGLYFISLTDSNKTYATKIIITD